MCVPLPLPSACLVGFSYCFIPQLSSRIFRVLRRYVNILSCCIRNVIFVYNMVYSRYVVVCIGTLSEGKEHDISNDVVVYFHSFAPRQVCAAAPVDLALALFRSRVVLGPHAWRALTYYCCLYLFYILSFSCVYERHYCTVTTGCIFHTSHTHNPPPPPQLVVATSTVEHDVPCHVTLLRRALHRNPGR